MVERRGQAAQRPHAAPRPIRKRGRRRGFAADHHDMLAPARKRIDGKGNQCMAAEFGQCLVATEATGLAARKDCTEDHGRTP
ncbi:hypothetical protein ADT71_20640 [Novosphingobium sp. ST904]|nr:hypothetical protein ADT71_20640 [Novosphingobium sp. ST904]